MVTQLLCLHGFTGSPKSFDFLPDTLPHLSPALLGHLDTTATDAVGSFEDEVERLAALIVSESTHLVGYSLGARLALSIALRYPARISRLTLVSAHYGLSSDAERAARRAADAGWCELLRTKGLTPFVDAWERQPLWASQACLPPEQRRRKRAERLSHSAEGLARSLRVTGLAEMPFLGLQLDKLRIRTDIVAGELDTKFCQLAYFLASNLASAQLQLVPAAGHDLLLERPEFITALIERGTPT